MSAFDWEDESDLFSRKVDKKVEYSRVCHNCGRNPTPHEGAGVCEHCEPLLMHTFENGIIKFAVFLQGRD